MSTKVMREEVAENSTWRPSSLKLPPASSSSSVSTNVFCRVDTDKLSPRYGHQDARQRHRRQSRRLCRLASVTPCRHSEAEQRPHDHRLHYLLPAAAPLCPAAAGMLRQPLKSRRKQSHRHPPR